MNPAYLMGKAAEDRAAQFFSDQGFYVRERNYRYRKAEVDLIVQKQDLLVAVEVKARRTDYFGAPAEFVHPKKIALLTMAMDHYIQFNDLEVEFRFDIMAYVVRNNHWAATHIKGAFISSHNVLFITINLNCIFAVKNVTMKTIASVVEHYIKSKPYLSTAMSQGIINLTSLARQIQPEIEETLQKPARNGAIVMALKRISDNLEFLSTHKIVKVLKGIGDITVRSSLIDYSFKISDSLLSAQANFLAEVNDQPQVFYTSSRGVTESNIIVSSNMEEKMEAYFKEETLVEKTTDLSSISIKLPTENVTIPGIYYFIFQRLSWEGVNIFEVISTSNEFTILVDEAHVNIAFKAIKDLKAL